MTLTANECVLLLTWRAGGFVLCRWTVRRTEGGTDVGVRRWRRHVVVVVVLVETAGAGRRRGVLTVRIRRDGQKVVGRHRAIAHRVRQKAAADLLHAVTRTQAVTGKVHDAMFIRGMVL